MGVLYGVFSASDFSRLGIKMLVIGIKPTSANGTCHRMGQGCVRLSGLTFGLLLGPTSISLSTKIAAMEEGREKRGKVMGTT